MEAYIQKPENLILLCVAAGGGMSRFAHRALLIMTADPSSASREFQLVKKYAPTGDRTMGEDVSIYDTPS